jgi:acyl dehydratase
MVVFKSLSALAAQRGKDIGVSPWIEVQQHLINQFAGLTGDVQWIHVDPARTQRELGTPPIAHGYLMLSLMPRFLGETFTVSSAKRLINYGSNKVRFLNPVYAGDRVRGHVVLSKAVLDDAMLRAHFTVSMEIEGNDRPGMHAEVITLMYT